MEKYTQALEIMFKNVSAREILKRHITFSAFGKSTFVLLANSSIPQYSNNEVENLYFFLQQERELYQKQILGIGDRYCREDEICVFDILLEFATNVLLENGNVPVCNYSRLLRWRTTTHKLGEDLFVAAYLAHRDIFRPGYRRDLRWDIVTGTNNISLQQMMEKGIAENHFHLKGSAPYFHLSWISMMNDINNPSFEKRLNEYDCWRLDKKCGYNPEYYEGALCTMYKQAAIIRLFLYMKLSGKRFVFGTCLVDAGIIKNILDYSVLEQFRWKKEDIKKQIEKEKIFYDKYSVKDILMNVELYNSTAEISESRMMDYSVCHDVIEVLDRYLFQEDLLDGTDENVSLAEIVSKTFLSGDNIPLFRVRKLISEQDCQKMEEEYNIETVYRMLCEPEIMELYLREIRELLLLQRWEQARCSGCSDVSDYAVPPEYNCEFDPDREAEARAGGGSPEEARNILTGERWILYQMFQKYYNREKGFEPYLNLFYAYLVMKENIRSELIQVNSNVGFSNFSLYEARKEDFVEGTVFEKHFLRIAIWDIIKRGNVRSLETRITPKMSVTADLCGIRNNDRKMDLSDEERERVFYVYHFVKEREKAEELKSDFLCHHAYLRRKVKKQALAFAKVRESCPEQARRVLGIDACNEEITCRPEVFAQAFRFLRNHVPVEKLLLKNHEKDVPFLGITYHVGEDFLDITDGLRAIDEACLFLNLKCGDRLGHALALGVDPREWYYGKNCRILLSKQAYLDNLVWLFIKIREIGAIGFEDLLLHIEKEYWFYFHEIYLKNVSDQYVDAVLEKKKRMYSGVLCETNRFNQFDINTYYDAWKLRGDNPGCYENGFYLNRTIPDYGWDMYAVNDESVEYQKLRNDFETSFLYHAYHYNPRVKQEGNKTLEVKVTEKMIQAVCLVQKYMQKVVASRGLAIETNPSSNYLIGTFKQYDRHPLLKFYNLELTTNEEELGKCPQLLCSINTDDQGVFATSLENEYALMLLALERMRDEEGKPKYSRERIYKWLDNIREMGIRQSFLRNRK